MRLNIGKICLVQRLEPFNCQFLGNIDVLTATVVTLTGIALSVFIGHLAALRFHHRWTGVVFRGNQLNMLLLTLIFLLDGLP